MTIDYAGDAVYQSPHPSIAPRKHCAGQGAMLVSITDMGNMDTATYLYARPRNYQGIFPG